MITLNRQLLAGVLCLLGTQASAYDLATHAKMINFAYGKSKLGSTDSSIQKRLGIDVWVLGASSNAPFQAGGSDLYYDIAQGQVAVRQSNSYEFDVMFKIKLQDEALKIPGWLMRGGIREDDGGLIAGARNNEPFDDPVNNFNRFCNHFLDPVSTHGSAGRGFSGFCFYESPISDAAQWALGTQNPFDAQPAENISRRNHFSVLDARDLMWRALTLRDKAGNDVPKNGFTPEQLRKIYWASTFRSLGDVIHLLQDQAQPQHTRNEGHGLSNKGYEEYIDARAKGSDTFTIDEQKLTLLAGQLPDLNYDGYAIPRFSRYSDYWSTRVNSSNIYGLSDYSNRGFFTVEKNFGNTIYPEPSSDISKYSVFPVFQSTWGGSFNHLVGQVEDKLTGASESVTMSTQSIFTGLVANGGAVIPPKYTLSKKNYDDRAALLIPRAVAYSAGLIDYFFRGELEISLPDEGVYAVVDYSKESTKDTGGFNKVKLKLTNKTPSISPSGGGTTVEQKLLPSGTVVAIAKFRRNKCYIENSLQGEIPVKRKEGSTIQQIFDDCRDKVEEIVVSDPVTLPRVLALDDIEPLTFNFKDRIPINVMDLVLQVVYRGQLGDETDAVVVTTKDVSEPTFFKLTDYFLMSIDPTSSAGNCKFIEPASVSVSPISFALTESATTPSYLVKAELNGKDYAMFAAISDLGPIKGRGVASWNGGSEMVLSSINSTMRFEAEFQPGPTLNSYITPTYRQAQFYPTAPGTLTLRNDVPPTLTKIRGVFADAGIFLDNNLDYKSCGARPTGVYLPTEGHSLMPPHNPLVPKALKELNF
jgi:hypothetical protein